MDWMALLFFFDWIDEMNWNWNGIIADEILETRIRQIGWSRTNIEIARMDSESRKNHKK